MRDSGSLSLSLATSEPLASPDHRSYRVNFDKIESLGWKVNHHAKEACLEIYDKLESGELKRDERTITLDWYKDLEKWNRIINETEMYGGMLEIN